MGKVPLELIKKLRELTRAGISDCKKALEEANLDLDKAVEILRVKGRAAAAKKVGRETAEGIIAAYLHFDGPKLGTLVELNCETDFVARTDLFKELANIIAEQIAAYGARYVSRESVPPEVIEREKEIYAKKAREEGKPEKVIDRIVNGMLEKFYKENCLLEQPYYRNEKMTVKQLIEEYIGKLGENIVVKRFVRFKIGEYDE
jgi:elongation factor Ts